LSPQVLKCRPTCTDSEAAFGLWQRVCRYWTLPFTDSLGGGHRGNKKRGKDIAFSKRSLAAGYWQM